MFDVGEIDGEVFFSMELVEGEDLAALLRRVGRLPSEKVIEIGHQLCGGLAAAHAQGVLHRDLKPANILIDDYGLVRITDFGIAVSTNGPSVTRDIAGTPLYMAPEQTAGAPLTERTDVYALGLVLYELLTGRHAFALEGTSREPDARPTRPSQLVPGVESRLERAILAALSPEPHRRPASAADMDAMLTAADRAANHQAGQASGWWRERWGLAVFALAAIIVAFAALAVYQTRVSSRPLTDQDTIILADMENTTGDPVFDGTLKQALAVALEQSPFLKILPDDRVQDTLRLMGRPVDARVTLQIAREVAQREGLKAVLAGSISTLGRNYVVSLETLNAETGEVMAREQVEAEGKERVLGSLGNATSRLRESLGESLPSIARFNIPPERATTASLDALKAYSMGVERLRGSPSLEAIPFLKRAIELDPEFALAYAQLSSVYTNTRQPALAPPMSEKAFALRDRVSERERFLISWRYYRDVAQDWEKALELARAWTGAYPREGVALNSLGLALLELNRHEQAVELFEQATRIDPGFLTPYLNLGSTLTTLGRYGEARRPLQYAADHGGGGAILPRDLYALAFVQNDIAAMQRLEEENAKTSENYAAFNWHGRREGFVGRLRAAHDSYRQGVRVALDRGLTGPAAQLESEDAEFHAVAGQCDDARTEAAAAAALSRDNFTLERTSRALAWCGALDEAAMLSRELATRFPEATLTRHQWLPVTASITALRRGDAARAIAMLEEVRPFEVGAQFWPSYVRGTAWLQLGDGAKARGQFQFILDHRGHNVFSPLYLLAHLGVARGAALVGDSSQARDAYDRFLAEWKNADPGLPALVEARRERAALK